MEKRIGDSIQRGLFTRVAVRLFSGLFDRRPEQFAPTDNQVY